MRSSLLLFLALLLDLLCVLWLLEPEAAPAAAAAAPVRAAVRAADGAPAPLPETASGRPAGAVAGTRAEPARSPVTGWRTLAEMAESLARLEHPEGALEILEAAVDAALAGPADERILFAAWLETNPTFAELRADERFLGLIDRLVAPAFAQLA